MKTHEDMTRWSLRGIAALTVLAIALPATQASGQGSDEAQIEALTEKLDTLYRSDSSRGEMKMVIVTPRFERTLEMKIVTRGMDDTLIRITSPRKERGVSTLKKGNEMWNYLPKIKKVVRVPPSMMMSSWMGSDVTNDDLVRGSEYREDYTVGVDHGASSKAEICLEYVPKEGAPVTWQKVMACFDRESKLPRRQEFYDEKGRKVRTMTFDRVRELDGRTIPTRMTITPHSEDKKGHETTIVFQKMDFDAKVSAREFSMTNLRRGR